MNHGKRLLWLLLNDSFTFLNAELNNKQLTECRYLTWLILLRQTGQNANKLLEVLCFSYIQEGTFNKNNFAVFLSSINMK